MYTKKTKIVATIGPASEDAKTLEAMIKAGLDVVRLNFSHGNFEDHRRKVARTRAIAKKLDKPVAILQDLGGPKIRIGEFTTGAIKLKAGQKFVLTTRRVAGDEEIVSVNYPKLPKEVKPGMTIFLEDGKKQLLVKRVSGDNIECQVIIGGWLKGKRGVNVPGAYLSISSLTPKDKKDLEFGLAEQVDYVALSFVRRASDIAELRQILDKKDKSIKIIAKIETKEAVENIDEILAVADGLMVARGDLAIEVPPEDVPIIQKDIIERANEAGKPVITATQMLESMTDNPLPTRAEVNDVANAIFDGTSAVMLSGESALGQYPLATIEMMARIARRSEEHIEHYEILKESYLEAKDITDSISFAALHTAHEVGAEAIVALSNSGFTARMIARHRPHRPVTVLTPNRKVYQQLALAFGCYPMMVNKEFGSVLDAIERSKQIIKQTNLVKVGGKIVIVAGVPFGKVSSTNLLVVQKI